MIGCQLSNVLANFPSRLDQGRNSVDGINQVDFEDKDCSSDRIMKQNQLQAGAQLRPSRSFDMLITAGKKRDDSVLSSSMGSSCCLPFGASPMYVLAYTCYRVFLVVRQ